MDSMPGTLVSPDGRVFPLARFTLVGRSPEAAVRIASPQVSHLHALLRWQKTGRIWEVLDLGSVNGTRLQGKPVEPGRFTPVALRARLGFGTNSVGWELVDDGAPGLHAVRLTDGAFEAASDGVLVLPDGSSFADVHQDTDGNWCLDRGGESPVADADVLRLDPPWRVHLPESVGTEHGHFRLEECTLHLYPSGKSVWAELETPAGRHDLEVRAHWRHALILARQLLADAAALPHERGWVENRLLAFEQDLSDGSIAEYNGRIRKYLASFPLLFPATAVEGQGSRSRLRGLRVQIHTS
jgi:hypothetical protein